MTCVATWFYYDGNSGSIPLVAFIGVLRGKAMQITLFHVFTTRNQTENSLPWNSKTCRKVGLKGQNLVIFLISSDWQLITITWNVCSLLVSMLLFFRLHQQANLPYHGGLFNRLDRGSSSLSSLEVEGSKDHSTPKTIGSWSCRKARELPPLCR